MARAPRDLAPIQGKGIVCRRLQPGREPLALAVEELPRPLPVYTGGVVDAEPLDLGGDHPQRLQRTTGRTQRCRVHHRQVPKERLLAADPLVVVGEVTAPVQDRAPPVDLDALHVVGGVAVHQLHPNFGDEPVGKTPPLLGTLKDWAFPPRQGAPAFSALVRC